MTGKQDDTGVGWQTILLFGLLVGMVAGMVGYGYGFTEGNQRAMNSFDDGPATVDCDIWSDNGSAQYVCFTSGNVRLSLNSELDHKWSNTSSGRVNMTGLPADNNTVYKKP